VAAGAIASPSSTPTTTPSTYATSPELVGEVG
jgi:hypothetical protein